MEHASRGRRIVIGDVHGELKRFKAILKHAGLIDEEGTWSGGEDTLIQVGDVIDRGPQSAEAMRLISELQEQATAVRGKVVGLLGNHELLLLQHRLYDLERKDLEPLANPIREEILKGNIIASYTDGTWLYTHAGLRSTIRRVLVSEIEPVRPRQKNRDIDLRQLSDYINEVLRQSLEKNDFNAHPIFHRGKDRGGNDPVSGIFWCDFDSINGSKDAATIPQIFGHTPGDKYEIRTAQGLRMINVDAGMHGGSTIYLEITADGSLIQHINAFGKWRAKILGDEIR
jgi:hypothetical protein